MRKVNVMEEYQFVLLPFKCWNNECRKNIKDCPTKISCPDDYLVLCSDGTYQKAIYYCIDKQIDDNINNDISSNLFRCYNDEERYSILLFLLIHLVVRILLNDGMVLVLIILVIVLKFLINVLKIILLDVMMVLVDLILKDVQLLVFALLKLQLNVLIILVEVH